MIVPFEVYENEKQRTENRITDYTVLQNDSAVSGSAFYRDSPVAGNDFYLDHITGL